MKFLKSFLKWFQRNSDAELECKQLILPECPMPSFAIADINNHPHTGRLMFDICYYDTDGDLIGSAFFPVSIAGLNEWFYHDEKLLGLRLNPVEKGWLRAIVSVGERYNLMAAFR